MSPDRERRSPDRVTLIAGMATRRNAIKYRLLALPDGCSEGNAWLSGSPALAPKKVLSIQAA